MNKKRLFGYLFVLVSVGNISAQESRCLLYTSDAADE